jgi:hypothetical protein
VLLVNKNAQGQTFHALLFCKTSDKDIGKYVRINYANVQQQFQIFASALGYKYVEYNATGPSFTYQNVMDYLSIREVKSQDIVMVYYSSHGAKTIEDDNIFPRVDVPSSMLPAYKQHQVLVRQGPKVVITIIEACSNYISSNPQKRFIYEQAIQGHSSETLSNLEITNIKKLFAQPCNFIVTAGNPGKKTWATPDGSMFTNCLLRALSESASTPSNQRYAVNWDNILNQTKQYTSAMTHTVSPKNWYYPVWEKSDCTGLHGQDLVDTTQVVDYQIKFDVESKRRFRLRNRTDVNLTVSLPDNSPVKIEKVIYYLHKSMENPIVERDNEDEDFFLSLAVHGTFPLKAKVYLSNNTIVDMYKNFKL